MEKYSRPTYTPSMQKYPMFWVKFEDIEPYISKLMIMTSNKNQAAKMSVADYLATNKYKGKIYMTTNLQNKAIMDYCKTDSAVQKEQKRIEKEVTDFEQHIWTPPVDSAAILKRDSIAAAKEAAKSKKKRVTKAAEGEAAEAAEEGETKKIRSRSSARRRTTDDGEAAEEKKPRVSARRQRH